ncbi:hypothetical protein N7478_002438 [Penicillium angulare]|uniref:uncharacterized protein n=1 Tax=Penicillium angulare TaxID=116970 RepID=UPI00253FD667|nr:uncharacterized protein N7478_002438 [Penicillium angulare]KAJ5286752.1 hypothetical protein N7478_002438 [Penicillium angulare]
MPDCRQEDLNESILFHTRDDTILLVDIPHSIAQAQRLSQGTNIRELQISPESVDFKTKNHRSILSLSPLEKSYDSSTEPKTQSARAKVLSRISSSEQRFHGQFILPLVASALDEIRAEYKSHNQRWCLPRVLHEEGHRGHQEESKLDELSSATKRKRIFEHSTSECVAEFTVKDELNNDLRLSINEPPTILSCTSSNLFPSVSKLTNTVVKNPSSKDATLLIGSPSKDNEDSESFYSRECTIPPHSNFALCTLPLSRQEPLDNPIPGLSSNHLFNLILFDPPWPNRSVKRSREYETHSYSDMDLLSKWIRDVLRVHAYRPPRDTKENLFSSALPPLAPNGKQNSSQENFAAIWITNSEKARKVAYEALLGSGFIIYEEWIWIKTTASGEAVCPLDGIWRKPYEILVIGRRYQTSMIPDLDINLGSTVQSAEDDLLGVDPGTIPRRVIAAVPDLHSRKPNLKPIFERLLFNSRSKEGGLESLLEYSALEVFARNLTAEWWACGNEVLKFNDRNHWIEQDDSI